MIAAIVLAFDAGAVVLAIWTLRLVRRDRLYVGYGVVALLSLAALVVFTSAAPARTALAAAVAVSRPLALAGLAGVLVGALLFIYVLSQLTIVSNRLTRVVQELALERTSGDRPRAGDSVRAAR